MGSIIEFVGDQLMAYLLISSASSAIPLTNKMREGADNIFTDTSSAAISLSLFAFLCTVSPHFRLQTFSSALCLKFSPIFFQ
ncbi:hypothetical protein Lal_00043000 [Lupinus albus]|nr:hypothetical protein Lal_00043000 [Lupinus albus]